MSSEGMSVINIAIFCSAVTGGWVILLIVTKDPNAIRTVAILLSVVIFIAIVLFGTTTKKFVGTH